MNIELNRDILNEIKTVDWFCNCGKEFTIKIPWFFEQVETVSRMKKEIANIKWENTIIEAQNDLSVFLFQNYREEIWNNHSDNCDWNNVVDRVKNNDVYNSIKEDFSKKIELYFGEDNNKTIFHDVDWCVIAIIKESTYCQYTTYKPHFYNHILDIYKSGHIPCG